MSAKRAEGWCNRIEVGGGIVCAQVAQEPERRQRLTTYTDCRPGGVQSKDRSRPNNRGRTEGKDKQEEKHGTRGVGGGGMAPPQRGGGDRKAVEYKFQIDVTTNIELYTWRRNQSSVVV